MDRTLVFNVSFLPLPVVLSASYQLEGEEAALSREGHSSLNPSGTVRGEPQVHNRDPSSMNGHPGRQ